jgi:GT2 family glycosyltransferase
MQPKYSVLIPVCHGGSFLSTALATLKKVAVPEKGFEVVLVGDSPEILKNMTSLQPEIRYIRKHAGSRAAALNAACAAARGCFWVFADDDCIFPQDWLLRIEHSLAVNPDAVVIGGRDELPHTAGAFDLALDQTLNSFAGTGGIRRNSGSKVGRYYPKLWNMTVRADAARQAAVKSMIFDPTLPVHEDVDLVERIIRQGGQVVHAPEIVVGHFRDTNFISFFFRNFRMARVCRVLGLHRHAHLALAAVVPGLLLFGIVTIAAPALKSVFFLLIGMYITALLLTGIGRALKTRRISLVILVPLLILTLHTARGLGYCLPAKPKESLCSPVP